MVAGLLRRARLQAVRLRASRTALRRAGGHVPVAPAPPAGRRAAPATAGPSPHGCGSQVPRSEWVERKPLPRAPHLIRRRRGTGVRRRHRDLNGGGMSMRTGAGTHASGPHAARIPMPSNCPAAPHPSTRLPGGVPGTGVIPRRRDFLDIADASDQHRIALVGKRVAYAAVPQSAAVGRFPAQQAALPGHGAGVALPTATCVMWVSSWTRTGRVSQGLWHLVGCAARCVAAQQALAPAPDAAAGQDRAGVLGEGGFPPPEPRSATPPGLLGSGPFEGPEDDDGRARYRRR